MIHQQGLNRRKKIVRWIFVTAVAFSIAVQPGCHLQAKRSPDFSVLTTPISYRSPQEDVANEPAGIAGTAKSVAKDSAAFIGTGLWMVGGLLAWVWLDDDESIIELH